MPDLDVLLIAAPTFIAAYAVFAMVGFGTTLISAPIVAQVVPLPTLIPAQALLDLVASIGNGMKLGAHLAKKEVLRMLPAMLAGLVLGAYLLLVIPMKALMVLLGAFVVLYALRGMRSPARRAPIRTGWAWWYGFSGGILSALFGAGAWLYAIYLMRRLDDPRAIRASQTAMIAISAVTRVGLFVVAGKYSDWNVIGLSLTMLPAMALGVYLGNRYAHRLDRAKFIRVLHLVLLATGSALLVRGLTA
ncbi:sulfite exporter TauE/SafE family protein [Bordetella petrii]|uniref:sulfite exporter TauE/SafE family protein n=1 Tax=Bordetella petrii TaxID=94624 RepID=UPI001E5A2E69|nr:sulfite exporter TauE/SafE family protein [Bordetella petrii]MCD0504594.1 sulfite exporter TauE/SafE family protein [Bordetella petrii]